MVTDRCTNYFQSPVTPPFGRIDTYEESMFSALSLATDASHATEKDIAMSVLSPLLCSQAHRSSGRLGNLLKATQQVEEAGFQTIAAASLLKTDAHLSSNCPGPAAEGEP